MHLCSLNIIKIVGYYFGLANIFKKTVEVMFDIVDSLVKKKHA